MKIISADRGPQYLTLIINKVTVAKNWRVTTKSAQQQREKWKGRRIRILYYYWECRFISIYVRIQVQFKVDQPLVAFAFHFIFANDLYKKTYNNKKQKHNRFWSAKVACCEHPLAFHHSTYTIITHAKGIRAYSVLLPEIKNKNMKSALIHRLSAGFWQVEYSTLYAVVDYSALMTWADYNSITN